MKKRSPPHFLADEHFNPPAAQQRSYSAGGGLDGGFETTSQRINDPECDGETS